MREAPHTNEDRRTPGETETVPLGSMPSIATVQAMEGLRDQLQPQHRMQRTPDEQPGARSRGRARGLEVKPLKDGRPKSVVPTEVNPTGMIHLPLRLGDKGKAKNLEVDFLVVDVPMAYNVIRGWATLHRVKTVTTPYLLHLQFEVDDGSIGTMQGDQRTARECYHVSIRPLVERMIGLETPPTGKKVQTGPPSRQQRPWSYT
ncbi:hypothetical protein Cgig2_023148 [Carnegiea gigantea]|uniref:Uncharacterized protein n=1 Tax=Carnegiea gigantea TaxID=171969 RepID=A0A9Q1QH32_9CARY|nr:hypothetical protein Cgig2_023148 [Carnegiea gigantea]